ncbi:hypothetical protein CL615_01235 [archaeon]|jgi:hypothetical protein|nr:hypothetical protein [archaeon]MDP6548383.1 UPF0182 family protein [Candidatus Woesearchaeota archaeon]|tara:strand:- start:22637 stop:25309 length:2673 start_codon:yes stop_codon:yes gene_type:complete
MAQGSIIKNNLFGFIILVVVIILFLSGLYADWLWFESLGYISVFKTFLFSKIALGFSVFLLFFIFLSLNLMVLKRKSKIAHNKIYITAITIVSIIAGLLSSASWLIVLRFLNFVGFGFVDPIFKNDISFYIFVLPFYKFAAGILFFLIAASIVMVAVAYLLSGKTKKTVQEPKQALPGFDPGFSQIKITVPKQGKNHLAFLAGFLLIITAVFFYLKRYSILFSTQGAVYGAGFTDITITLPLYTILPIIGAVAAFIAFTYPYLQNTKLVVGSISFFVIILFAGTIIAGAVQLLYVQPNEFNIEEKYIKQNIKHTLFAYKLSDASTRDFPVSYNLSIDDIYKNKATIENVRLWDWRPLLTTYRQIQLFRTYYDFLDVDIDRYNLDGRLRQIMVSPRELDQNQLDSKAKTWVNKKFVYTHGYGVVASPINMINSEGLPELFINDIPPKTRYKDLEIEQPGIYFGEKTDSFVVVNTKTNEFDYPLGNENVFASYDGAAGIQLSNIIKKGVFSLNLGSLNLFISGAVTKDSKVLIKRNIIERTSALAPFLQYDSDPYIVVNDGRIYWILDAYTTSNKFPYSENIFGLNYIRNSVKVTIDAFDGNVDFYIIDEEDPIIQNYAKIFPSLFKNFDEMPEGLQEHIRYPEDLMRVQTRIFGTYHMKDPQVFYNKEDVWVTPTEIYSSNEIELKPYYIILKLPEEEKEGFFLITPLIPRGKQNMIAWFAAHSDPKDYGKLEVFRLSKQELTYGPMQIEARIDQDTEISQLLTLWGQQGSEVIRGNLIIIPIEQSFLYIEPVYLKASAGGALPQLKRVIVAYEDKVTMQNSLEEALSDIFKGKVEKSKKKISDLKVPETISEKFSTASALYNEAQEALLEGDFVTYAEKIEELGNILNDE